MNEQKQKQKQSNFESFTHLFLCSAQRSFSQFAGMAYQIVSRKMEKLLVFFPTLRNFFVIYIMAFCRLLFRSCARCFMYVFAAKNINVSKCVCVRLMMMA